MRNCRRSVFICLQMLILVFAVVLVSSCCGSASREPVDISKLVEEFEQHNDSAEDKIFALEYEELAAPIQLADSLYCHGLCSTGEWWFRPSNPLIGSERAEKLVEFYNYGAFMNSIGADYEILLRGFLTNEEPLAPEDVVIDAIRNIEMSVLRNSEDAKALRAEIVWALGNSSKWTEKRSPIVAFSKFGDVISAKYDECSVDSVDVKDYFLSVDSMLAIYLPVQKEIAALDEEARFGRLLQKVSEANSFDDQCGITLVCCMNNKTFADVWSLKLMRQLLESGKYSILLDRMWIVWRTLCQTSLCGMSRDSVIPNHSYEKLRKKVFATIISQMSKAPSDKMVPAQAAVLGNDSHLIRNGSFIYGNDAALYMHYYCPDFYKNSLGE